MKAPSRLVAVYLHFLLVCVCWRGAEPALCAAGIPSVRVARVPDGGLQPQTAVDDAGAIHLVYLKGDPARGDLFYVRMDPGNAAWSQPIPVNSQSGNAMAIGSIRGAQIALGRNGRVHVVWNGCVPLQGARQSALPMLYTRLNDTGSAFEPERDVITKAYGLDGGGSVAADSAGHVYVIWHAPIPGAGEGESHRAVFVAKSSDDGRTFAPEKRALARNTGACGCCGLRAFADQTGHVYVLYRAASEKVNRDEVLLVSKNGTDFEWVHSDPWNTPNCPMSSAAFALGRKGVLAAWETEGRVRFSNLDPKTLRIDPPISPGDGKKEKHPVIASNARGDVLAAWTEGTGWQKGGALAWRLFDSKGEPLAAIERQAGIPVWSFAAVAARPDNSFVILY